MSEREPYGVNVGRWTADHPGWALRGGDGGFGFAAQRVRRGGCYGPVLTEPTLDALAVTVEQDTP